MNNTSSSLFEQSYLTEFFGMVCSEELSAERVLRQLYPNGAKCASCGSAITGNRSTATFWAGKRTWCAHCETKFSPRSGTILQDSHLSFSRFETMIICFSLGADHRQVSKLIGVHEDTVKAWQSKISFWKSHV